MKFKNHLQIDKSLCRQGATTSSSSIANSASLALLVNSLNRRKINFPSLRSIRQNLSHAIENDMVNKVNEILSLFEAKLAN